MRTMCSAALAAALLMGTGCSQNTKPPTANTPTSTPGKTVSAVPVAKTPAEPDPQAVEPRVTEVASDAENPDAAAASPTAPASVGQPSPTQAVTTQAVTTEAVTTEANPAQPSPVQPSPARPSPVPSSPADGPATPPATASAATASAATPQGSSQREAFRPAERFVLLAGGGPIIVDLGITIDGEPHAVVAERMVDQVLNVADANHDGTATWDEVFQSPQLKYGQFGNPVFNDEAQHRELRAQYDINRNRRLDRDEVPRLLTRNTGPRAVSFTSSKRSRGKSSSPIRELLSVDGDSLLSSDEFAEAAIRLRTRDADEDDSLTMTDFRPAPTFPQLQMPDRNSGTGTEAAVLITETANWEDIAYIFSEAYGELNESSFALAPGLCQKLDLDQDGKVDEIELRGLYRKAEPHVQLAVAFGDRRASRDVLPMQLVYVAPELDSVKLSLTASASRVTIQLPRLELTFAVNDQVAAADLDQQAQAQLKSLDADSNGYLETSEVPDVFAGEVPFEALDVDQDGKVYPAELVTYLNQRQVAARTLVQTQVSEDDDALFAALDTNNDGRLGSRELERAVAVFEALDKNGDGQVRPSEIPDNISVSIGRGGGQPFLAVALTPPVMPASRPDVPAWFLRMDVNADGELGPREFLGDAGRFHQLDTDGDGFVTSSEISSPAPPPSAGS